MFPTISKMFKLKEKIPTKRRCLFLNAISNSNAGDSSVINLMTFNLKVSTNLFDVLVIEMQTTDFHCDRSSAVENSSQACKGSTVKARLTIVKKKFKRFENLPALLIMSKNYGSYGLCVRIAGVQKRDRE